MLTRVLDIEELVINWHVTEACNFRCRYCFAAWEQESATAEVWRDKGTTRDLLSALFDFFSPGNLSNPLRAGLRWRSVRLSLAGGEPTLLGDRLADIAAEARTLGFRVSVITNGSRPDVIASAAPHLDMIGISLDSADPETSAAIGRACRRGATTSADAAARIVDRARAARPDMVVKVNTVVSAANADEDLTPLIARLRPDRWKVMRVLPVLAETLAVDEAAFRAFVKRHRSFRALMTVEDNADMERSYVMVDPHGRFFQNGCGGPGYIYSRRVLDVGAGAAFDEVDFLPDAFASRYPRALAGGAA